jgi:hypothetical protein
LYLVSTGGYYKSVGLFCNIKDMGRGLTQIGAEVKGKEKEERGKVCTIVHMGFSHGSTRLPAGRQGSNTDKILRD